MTPTFQTFSPSPLVFRITSNERLRYDTKIADSKTKAGIPPQPATIQVFGRNESSIQVFGMGCGSRDGRTPGHRLNSLRIGYHGVVTMISARRLRQPKRATNDQTHDHEQIPTRRRYVENTNSQSGSQLGFCTSKPQQAPS